MASHSLQKMVLPDIESTASPELYFRGILTVDLQSSSLTIPAGGALSTDTYFNAFSVRYWAEKTGLEKARIALILGHGRGTVRFFHRSDVGIFQQGESVVFDCSEPTVIEAEFSIPTIRSGFIYWAIVTDRETLLRDFVYGATEAPRREVRLGIVVTTYMNEERVHDTMRRFRQSTLPRSGHLLLVIDNGNSLVSGAFDGGEIIANRNLGGAGGFSRGLIELKDRHQITHALFMDDDAIAHMQCIEKTVALLRYVSSDNVAISGAMLVRQEPWRIFEAGGQMSKFGVMPIKNGLDLRPAESLLDADIPDRVDYGAWWFFAFPLAKVDRLAFPFFVRGDDIEFSISHGFDVLTPTGVAVWHDDFYDRLTPATEYLAHRSNLLIGLLRSSGSALSILQLVRRLGRAIRTDAAAYRYGVASARCDGVADVLKGPDFWRENPIMIDRLAELKQRYIADFPRAVEDRPASNATRLAPSFGKEPWPKRVIRRLTFDGHLLPTFLLRSAPGVAPGFTSQPAAAFGNAIAIYAARYSDDVVIAERAPRAYFALRRRLLSLRMKALWKLPRLFHQYRKAWPELVSAQYWSTALAIPAQSSRAAMRATDNPAALGPKRVPDFLGIGSEKCGTTWLWNYFRSHPDVGVPALKELRFFSRHHFGRAPLAAALTELLDAQHHESKAEHWLDRLACEVRMTYGGGDGYQAIFGGLQAPVVGEITPSYCALPDAAIRDIQALNPEMKLIFLLRDPTDRAISGGKMKARESENELSDEIVLRFATHPFQLRLSRYSESLARFEGFFPAEQIFVGFYDELVDDPAGLVTRVCNFLGVAPIIEDMPTTAVINRGPIFDVSPQTRRKVQALLVDEYEVLRKRFPDQVDKWLKD